MADVSHEAVDIARVRGWLIALELIEPLQSSQGVSGIRPVGVIELITHDGRSGWGEIDSMPTAGYTPHDVAQSFRWVQRQAPRLLAKEPLSSPGTWPFAHAALDGAAVDLEAKQQSISLAHLLDPTSAPTVAAGAVVGRFDRTADLVERVGRLRAEGYQRIKMKVEPGWDLEPLRAVRATFPDLIIHADANGAYRAEDIGRLRQLAECNIAVFEQPFAADDPDSHGRLRGVDYPIALDESALLWEQTEWRDAADALVIKPGRYGSWRHAFDQAKRAADHGLGVVAGGMLESGLGRRALAALAATGPFDLIGDCSPATRWYHRDPWPTEAVEPNGQLQVFSGPGTAPDPDRTLLEELATERFDVSPN